MKINKKGFTLIELLAVIAILAILIVIAVPAVLDLFTSSKENAFVTQAQSLFKAAEQQIISNQIDPTNDTPLTQFCYVYTDASTSEIGSDTVSLEGTKKISYNILVSGGKITYFAVSNKDYSVTIPTSAEITVSDIGVIDDPYEAVTSCD